MPLNFRVRGWHGLTPAVERAADHTAGERLAASTQHSQRPITPSYDNDRQALTPRRDKGSPH